MSTNYDIVSKVIKERRSIFPASYIKKEISVEVINQILEVANYAPTHDSTLAIYGNKKGRVTEVRGGVGKVI